MAQETQQLETARQLTEQVMGQADPNEPAHKLASALSLVIEVMHSAPARPTPDEMRAAMQHAAEQVNAAARQQAQQPEGGTVIEAAPPAAPIRSLASVPPGSYEAPRNQDGTVATTGAAAAPSLYEQRRNEDGSIASE